MHWFIQQRFISSFCLPDTTLGPLHTVVNKAELVPQFSVVEGLEESTRVVWKQE